MDVQVELTAETPDAELEEEIDLNETPMTYLPMQQLAVETITSFNYLTSNVSLNALFWT